ncbi:MAG TPA: DUF3037 domain-containing protein [Steroidobacteraceae bacterium]|nr:DUF3037 domain-containing protein [Steroidobacteraceae bacterium]
MPTTPCAYDYAVIRVVPRVEREEFLNVGVILSCPAQDFLAAALHVDRSRLAAIDPALDMDELEQHLAVIPLVCRGDAAAGTIGRLPARQRFHWLVAPRSTVIQTSAVHSGLCIDPAGTLQHLMQRMVLPPVA